MDYEILAFQVRQACELVHERERRSQGMLRFPIERANDFSSAIESSIHRHCIWFERWIGRIAHQPAVPHLKSPCPKSGVGFRVRDLHDRGALLIKTAEEFHNFSGLAGMQ